jgi:glycosyltransferase involved in cell wall biosynthesis
MNKILKVLWNIAFFRTIFYINSIGAMKILFFCRSFYKQAKVLCFNLRLLSEESYFEHGQNCIDKHCHKYIQDTFNQLVEDLSSGKNFVYESFLKSKKAKKYKEYFLGLPPSYCVSLKYPKERDDEGRQGDLMVLKKYNEDSGEKGVILIHYTESIGKFCALYNIRELACKYIFIIEPSWWGYQNQYFLFMLGLDTEVIIESPYYKDYEFIKKIGNNFIPTKIGAGDWVDPKCFYDGKNIEKKYDIVMVGNWSKIKRHELLFRSISPFQNKSEIRIALIGYSSKGRTRIDIENEARKYELLTNIEIFENIPPEKVAEILRQSKVNVLLSKKEGANRGIYEGMFCGNVVVVYEGNLGVNKENINEKTGFLTSEKQLHRIIEAAINEYYKYSTADWANENTGYKVTTERLNTILKNIVEKKGGIWRVDIVQKMNRPNGIYASESERLLMIPEYERLKTYLHQR